MNNNVLLLLAFVLGAGVVLAVVYLQGSASIVPQDISEVEAQRGDLTTHHRHSHVSPTTSSSNGAASSGDPAAIIARQCLQAFDAPKPGTIGFVGCILCAGVSPAHAQSREAERGLVDMVEARTQTTNVSKVFSGIYSTKLWGDFGGGSGVGSDPDAVALTGYIVRTIMYRFGVTSLLDAPCGGVSDSWTRRLITSYKMDVPCFQYHGVDAAASVIDKNVAAFKELNKDGEWARFSAVDLSSGTARLPNGFDLILSRDALQHLSYSTIRGAIRTYCRSDAKLLLVGSYLDSKANADIKNGGYFGINLLLPPFNFPPPFESIDEGRIDEAKYKIPFPLPRKSLLLYSLPELCATDSVRAIVAAAP
eukprot:m.222887 g.222887  ORF g.222887 m.222887 type:complete len:364 (+) comp10844_c0_seq1:179-1270(+)